MKLCTVCGVVTSRSGSRCTVHARLSNRSRHKALYSTRAWQRLSARVIARHRGQYGNQCPGYGRDPHPAIDLTADHVVPLAAGGAPLDIGNLTVLARRGQRFPNDHPGHRRPRFEVSPGFSPLVLDRGAPRPRSRRSRRTEAHESVLSR